MEKAQMWEKTVLNKPLNMC